MTALDLPTGAGGKITIEIGDYQIPYEKLGPENPIRHSGMHYLFETDLEDCGYSMG